MNLLTLKKYFASVYFVLNLIFFYLSSNFHAYSANADIIYSHHNNHKSENLKKKIDEMFNKSQFFKKKIEPKSEFSDSKGALRTLKDFRGKFLFIYFWASWCNQCKEDLRMLQKLSDELKYKSIDSIMVLPVSLDYKPIDQVITSASGYIKDLELYRDDYKELMDSLKVKSLPTSIFINQEGYVVLSYEGNVKWDSDYFLLKLVEFSKQKPKEDAGIDIDAQKDHDTIQKEGIMQPETNKKTIYIN